MLSVNGCHLLWCATVNIPLIISGLFHDYLKLVHIIVHGIKCFHVFKTKLDKHLIDIMTRNPSAVPKTAY